MPSAPPTNRRRLRLAFLLVAISALLVGITGTASAEGDLEIQADANYSLPADGSRLEVSVHFTLTNQKPNTQSGGVITQYYFDRYPFLVPDEAVDITATDARGRNLPITDEVRAIDEEGTLRRVITVRFPARLYYRGTQEFTVDFGLVGGEPRSNSSVRTNPAYAAFHVWAWGDPGLSDVAIQIPNDYEVRYSGASLITRVTADGESWYRNDIPDPANWAVFFTARRDAALASDVVEHDGLVVTVHSWPGDTIWADRVLDVVRKGLPALQRVVGLDFGEQTTLDILEALDPSLVGYAGWYLQDEDVIEMGEHLDDHVTLHEISHLWFNTDLFDSRWINEGLADEFADKVVKEIGAEADPAYGRLRPPITSREAAVPLNDWRFPYTAPAGDEATSLREDYGYNASFYVIRVLRNEIGSDAMIAVLGAADDDLIAYRGSGEPELVPAKDDWRRFLDLLEEVGGSEKAEEVFRNYVVNEEQAAALDVRAEARDTYRLLRLADTDWETPAIVRLRLSQWRFDDASELMMASTSVIAARDELSEIADGLGLQPPASLQNAYESASSLAALSSANTLGGRQLEGANALVEARTTLDAPRGFFASVGLWGANPGAEWQIAATRFETGDLQGTLDAAAQVIATIDGAATAGTTRIALTVVLVLLGAAAWWILRRRRAASTDALSPETS